MELDDLRSYLQMASGLTEATASKAKDVVTGLLSHGISLSSRAMPAPEMMGQVQELADELVATSRSNREMLVGVIRTEVDRAVGRMGFVREDELAALRRHVQRLEKQLNDLQATGSGQTYPATPAPEETAAESVAAVVAESVAAVVAEPESATAAAGVAPAPAPAPKKKKKIIVDEGA